MLTKHKFYLLFTIVVLGAGLRLVSLSFFPPSLNWDEVSLGYNAYSLLHTGQDEWGITLPVIFRAFGDYKLPVYVYATVLSEKIFGITPFAVRLFSSLCGIGLIILSFLLARRIFPRYPHAAWISSLLVALSPWTWFMSRIALEANAGAFLISLGLYLLLTRRYFLSALFLSLSVWTYNSARVFVPVFLFIYGFIHIRSLISFVRTHRRQTLFILILYALLLIPMFIQLISPSGQSRIRWMTLLDDGAIARIVHLRNSSRLPGTLPRLVYNKATYFVTTAAGNYLSYFSPRFLFLSGGSHYQFSIPGHGLLYLSDLPFFILGLLIIARTPFPARKFVLLWLFLFPLAGSITRDSPHTLRAIPFLPLPMLITGLGASLAWKFPFPVRAVGLAYLLGLFISTWIYFAGAVPRYTKQYSWSWQYGYPQTVNFIRDNYSRYDQIIFTKKYGEPHEFVLFYYPWPPQQFLADPGLSRYYKSLWYWTDSFAKFRFVNDWELTEVVSGLKSGQKYLIISGPQELPAKQVAQINFLDHLPAFIIWEK